MKISICRQVSLVIFGLFFAASLSAQPDEKPELSSEETQKRIEAAKKMIAERVTEQATLIAEQVDLREDQSEAFNRALVAHLVTVQKARMTMSRLRKEADGDRSALRGPMTEMRGTIEKSRRETDKAMKEVLDKTQYKAYAKAMDEAAAPQQRTGGQGGRGQRRG